MSNLSLVERSINVPGDDRFVEGVKDDVVFLCVVFVHEVTSCSSYICFSLSSVVSLSISIAFGSFR